MSGALLATTGGLRDVVPAAVDWTNIFDISSPGVTNTQTISGISQAISLRAEISGFTSTGTGGRQLIAYVNGVSVGNVTAANGAQINFNVNNGDTVFFETTQGGLRGSPLPTWGGTVTVTNQSNGGATLDTFTVYQEAA